MPRQGYRTQCVAIPAVLAASVSLALAPPPPEAEEEARELRIEPIEIDMIERAERTLLLLDVEAVDRKGLPLTGLLKDDFKIRVNYVWRKIYSVDDLCPCGDAAPDPDNPPTDPREVARLAVIQAPPPFVMYFDYSQLGVLGRRQAVEEASRWAREVMRPDDRVMVVAYAPEVGLRTLTEFSDDPQAVIRAIEAGAANPELRDEFPEQYAGRTERCATGTVSCSNTGMMEYRHARRSMETLRNFVTDLDRFPERKALVLFHENATMFPGRMYGQAPGYLPHTLQDEIRGYDNPFVERVSTMRGARGWVPDLLELEEELGGAATASRTVVYPMLCGTARPWSVNLSANLADQTGGDYNRRVEDLQSTLAEAGRGCPCLYRIGLEMSGKERSYVLRTKVMVNGRSLPARYRVEHLTKGDRWMRKAQLVMANPGGWRDLDVRAAVIPVRAGNKTWDVSVQVAVDISTLERSLEGEHDGEWEVAALLGLEDFRKNWEMLGVYRARPGDENRASGVVLHARTIKDLKPGRYTLRAFARDRESDRFGGAAFEIDLPAPGAGGLIGPVMVQPDAWHFKSPLPLRKGKSPPVSEATPRELGGLPLGDRATVAPGEPVQFLVWYCAEDPSVLRSAVRQDGGESWTFKPRDVEPSGRCVRVSSIVDTDNLPPGRYAYEMHSGSATHAAGSFEVVARDAGQVILSSDR